jgi:anaerobic ribonucleoside-triphosphate reductase
LKVIKRDGRKQEFSKDKLYDAVFQAASRVSEDDAPEIADEVSTAVAEYIIGSCDEITVDDIHGTIEDFLMKYYPVVAKEYIIYRQHRTDIRESKSDLMAAIEEISKEMHHDNANTNNSAASKMYGIAEAANKKYVLSKLLKPIHRENHLKGKVYINDLGYYQQTFNCFFNPIGQMLEHGFDNGVGSIRSPKRIGSAMALVAIILQSSQNSMFGGQGVVNFDTDLAPYVEREYDWQEDQVVWPRFGGKPERCSLSLQQDVYDLAMEYTEEAVYQACEAFVYNMNTMRSRSGAQVTFSSVNFGTDTSEFGRMISRNLLKAYIAGLGNGENPVFPNLCFRVKSGVNLEPETPNYDLFQLAIECVGKRIQPRFVFADSPAYPDWTTAATMGCRTAVRTNVNGDVSPDARGNLAFNNISLPYVALEAKETGVDFMDALGQAVDEAIDQLLDRYRVIANLRVKDVPFVSNWYQGHEGLTPDDTIEPMVKNGSLSVGFIGLAECLKALCGKHHGESEESQQYGLEIVRFIRGKTDEATQKYHLNFSTFATPAESACYTLLKLARERFGVIPGVTDKEYFTNSSHLPVDFPCDIQKKIDIEAPYHLLCNAGHILYVEAGISPKFNPKGTEEVIRYMAMSGAVYGGINFVNDFCNSCHKQGTFGDGVCPYCGSDDIKRVAIITGYLSTEDRFNPGKAAELKSRVSHAGGAIG